PREVPRSLTSFCTYAQDFRDVFSSGIVLLTTSRLDGRTGEFSQTHSTTGLQRGVPMRALCLAALMMLVAAIALPDSAFVALAGPGPATKAASLPKALFLALPHPGSTAPVTAVPGIQLTQWNGSFTDLTSKTVSYTMVGPNPATTNASATVGVVIIPIK